MQAFAKSMSQLRSTGGRQRRGVGTGAGCEEQAATHDTAGLHAEHSRVALWVRKPSARQQVAGRVGVAKRGVPAARTAHSSTQPGAGAQRALAHPDRQASQGHARTQTRPRQCRRRW